MRTKGGSPNLINGVSRQPPEVRLVSQLEESVNQLPTVSRGLVPRNPTMLVASIDGAIPAGTKVHLIDRDDDERYKVLANQDGITVTALDGTPRTVTAPNGYGYLDGASEEDLELLTVADHTFVLNKTVAVWENPFAADPLERSSLIHVVRGDYFATYQVVVNGTVRASYTTSGGPYADEADARSAERGARPEVIAHMLAYGSAPSGTGTTLPAAPASNLATTLGQTNWSIQVNGNVIYLANNNGSNFSIEVEDGGGDRIRAHKDRTPSFSDLPRKASRGFTIKVSGSEDSGYDDYWVRYDWPIGAAEGTWKETVGPGVRYGFDWSTMPHVLVRNADGTFTFKRAEWADREVGDYKTNPWPSFVGHRIDGLAFGNNRLGLFSGESLSQSRSGDFFNFWIESILTPLDTDPVDASISYPEVSNINHAVPFSGETILFTSSVPFRLGKGDTLTQKNVHYEHLIENKVSKRARPVAAGSKLYFANDTASGCFVHEFSYDRTVDNLAAQCITDHVPGYIPSGVHLMEADGDLKVLALVSSEDPTTLYTYKWLWIGNDKAQSAWQKWTLDAEIVGMRFYGEELVLVTNRDTTHEIVSINCHEAWKDERPCAFLLDRQVRPEGTYSEATGLTSYSLPYPALGVSVVCRSIGDLFGVQPRVVSRVGSAVSLEGDWSSEDVAFGFEFESYGVLSPLLHRTQNNQGAYGNAIPGMVTTVSNLRFGTGEGAFLRVELLRDYRRPVTYDFSAALVGTKTGALTGLALGPINKNVSVMAKSDDFRIKFGNRGPYPYSVMSHGWSGDTYPTSY